MTLKQFLDVAKKLEWNIYSGDRIRTEGKGGWLYCPIAAVCNLLHGTEFQSTQTIEASAKLGLSDKLRLDIINAADYSERSWPLVNVPGVRRKLEALIGDVKHDDTHV